MVEKSITSTFNFIYYTLKLNMFFFVLSLLGLGLFGVSPALATLFTLHKEAHFDYMQLTFKDAWTLYKHYFVRSQKYTAVFGFVLLVLSYNLFLSVQISGLLFVIIDFLLIVLLSYGILTYLYSLYIFIEYDTAFKNNLKLAVVSPFLIPRQSLAILSIIILISVLTFFFPVLLFFFLCGVGIILFEMLAGTLTEKVESFVS